MKKTINCAAFILVKGNKFLVEKRTKNKSIAAGLIAISGGRAEENETIESAFKRELKEELAVVPKNHEFLCKIMPPKNGDRIVHYFVVKDWIGELKPIEAEKIFWIKFSEYKKLDLDCDRKAIQKYLKTSRGR